MKTVLITGGAGFIASNLTKELLFLGYRVVSVDNFDSTYDPSFKEEHISPFLLPKNGEMCSSLKLGSYVLSKLSTETTLYPRKRSSLVRLEAIKPAPPVINTVFILCEKYRYN